MCENERFAQRLAGMAILPIQRRWPCVMPVKSMSTRPSQSPFAAADSERIGERAAFEALARSIDPVRPVLARHVLSSAALADSAGLFESMIHGKNRVVASMHRPGRFGRFADRMARLFDCSIAAAEDLARRLEDEGSWGPGLLPGSQMIPVLAGPKYPRAIASFVKFVPGLHFPLHSHPDGEITFVLEGAFRDASGVRIARGDELALGDDVVHDFIVLDEGPCIAAAIAYDGIDLK